MLTVRRRVLEAIKAQLEDLPNNPNGADYPLHFSVVEIGPLGKAETRKQYAVGIETGPEKKNTRFPITDCRLPVTLTMRMTVNRGDEKSALEAEKLLGVAQKKILEDITLGGLAIDVRETGNEVFLELYEDRMVYVALYLEVLYRHNTKDPTQLV